MGCRIACWRVLAIVVLADMDFPRVRSGRGSLPVHKAAGSHLTSHGRSPASEGGGDSRSTSYLNPDLVDEFHQAWITYGVAGWG